MSDDPPAQPSPVIAGVPPVIPAKQSIVDGLQQHVTKHALSYVIALLLGFGASLTAVYDNFWSLEPDQMAKIGWWQVIALVAKCMAPFATAVVGYLIKSPIEPKTSTPPPAQT